MSQETILEDLRTFRPHLPPHSWPILRENIYNLVLQGWRGLFPSPDKPTQPTGERTLGDRLHDNQEAVRRVQEQLRR